MLDELRQDSARPSRMSAGNLLKGPLPPVTLTQSETPTRLRLETDSWRIEISKKRWGMTLANKRTGVTWQLTDNSPQSGGITWTDASDQQSVRLVLSGVQKIERHGNSWTIQCALEGSVNAVTLELTVVAQSVIRLSVRDPHPVHSGKLKLNFIGAGPFFGLGERFSGSRLDGQKIRLHPEDLLGRSDHNWTYVPVPFLLTPRGMGLYLDTGAISTFDLSATEQGRFSIEIEHPSVECYFFTDDSPKDTIRDYTALTGRSPSLPPWAFGIWICSYQGPEKVLADAQKLRENKIPSSAIWLFDAMGHGDIMGWPLWWTGYYPDPRRVTDQLHSLGFKVLTYTHPYIRSILDPYNLPNPNFEDAIRKGFFVVDDTGHPAGPRFEPYIDGNIDFTNPTAVDWWEKKIREIVIDYNFDGWMEDFGEWIRDTDRFAGGRTGHDLANLYPLLYHKITHDIARQAKPDIVEFVRSGYAGSQGYTPIVWGGDQFPDWSAANGLPSVISAGITAGLSGFATWGPDIAENGHSKELWTRWTEFGALTPIMRNHLWDKPPGAVTLWSDSETIEIFRRYAELHVSLFPYFYSYASQAEKTGLPIIRHPMLEFPDDAQTYGAEFEYLLGEKILVAPVVEPQVSSRSLYLPRGSWVDYWTEQVIEGGKQVTVPAPLERIPLFVRAGSVIPFIPGKTETLARDLAGDRFTTLTNTLILRVFPASEPAHDNFTLYDGATVAADQDSSKIHVRVSNSPVVHHYEVTLSGLSQTKQVTLGGESLKEVAHATDNNAEVGWWLDPDSTSLHIVFSRRDFELFINR